MGSKKTKKKQHLRHNRRSLTTLLAFTLMLGAIIAGLLILSYQPQSDQLSNSSVGTIQPVQENQSRKTPQSSLSLITQKIATDSVALLPRDALKAKHKELLSPQVAIIMDDLGASINKATLVATLDIPVTMSIIPTLGHARETMHVAARHAREIMIHIPMEPLNYPYPDPGDMALMSNMSDAEIKNIIADFLHMLPYATGSNNHMGSAFTQHPHQMSVALELIAERGMFFIDSLTSPSSIGALEAARMHIPTATRDVFLDNDRDVAKITVQLTQLLQIAQKNGSAIGICHPYPETITALRKLSKLAEQHGVAVVKVAELLH
ncbi:MAG: divergent polysaccharide deacetylase family protein [Desulfuromonadaceae bacterium]|nr:divergent polysaccharide deacetylase family protein [Desulfuromonadaceae bacterium]